MTTMVRFTGGPGVDRERPLLLPRTVANPPFICSRVGGGVWRHYALRDGVYEYADLCARIDHDGAAPHEHLICVPKEGP